MTIPGQANVGLPWVLVGLPRVLVELRWASVGLRCPSLAFAGPLLAYAEPPWSPTHRGRRHRTLWWCQASSPLSLDTVVVSGILAVVVGHAGGVRQRV
jgi:hypothetical protein